MQEYKHLFWSCLLFKIFVFQTNKLNWLTSFLLYSSLFAVIMSLVLKKRIFKVGGVRKWSVSDCCIDGDEFFFNFPMHVRQHLSSLCLVDRICQLWVLAQKPHNCTLGQVTMVLLTSTFKKIKMLLESFSAIQS